jgi:tRNA (adenine57-N1/adenine58-N1)-methyltransferase catalytic subunit
MKALAIQERLFIFKKDDIHTQYGVVKKEAIKKAKAGDVLKTNTGTEMTVIIPDFSDLYHKIKRMAQVIPIKDIGQIVCWTGINKKSTVLEAGSGSGALTLMLSNICKKVYTYEIREDFFGVVKKNLEFFSVKNVVQKLKDVYAGIDEKNLDLIVFDLPEPWKAVPHALGALRPGGHLVSYSPSIVQTSDFIKEVKKTNGFTVQKTIEIIERIWEVDERKIRPKFQPITHSGFLSFVRKI